MTSPKYDVVGIGNAIMDVLVSANDETVAALDMPKGSMRLIDEGEADRLYAAMDDTKVTAPGGSVANSIAGLALLGGRSALLGRTRDDEVGRAYAQGLRDTGIHFETAAAKDGAGTGRCLIFVSPDAQRTMNTFLGAGADFTKDDLEEDVIAASAVTYLEGYLYSTPTTKDAFDKAIAIAEAAGRKVALSLSDPFCVEGHLEDFRRIVAEDVDILFANIDEAKMLYGTDDVDEVIKRAAADCDIAAITQGPDGATLVRGDERAFVPAEPLGAVVDTTGAGDQFAAGVLYGLATGDDLARAAKLGALMAGEVISHFGPRPEADVKALAKEAGLL